MQHIKDCLVNDCRCEERRYRLLIFIALLTAILEVVGSSASHSLSLLSDSFHVIIDGLAYAVAYYAAILVRRGGNRRTTMSRGGIINSILLFIAALLIIPQSYSRYQHPLVINGWLMFIISFIGLWGNVIALHINHKNEADHVVHRSINLHTLFDLLQSIVVIGVAIVIIFAPKATLLDPLASFLLAVVFIWQAVKLFRESLQNLSPTKI